MGGESVFLGSPGTKGGENLGTPRFLESMGSLRGAGVG